MDFLYAYCARVGKDTRVHLWIFYMHIVREPLIEFGTWKPVNHYSYWDTADFAACLPVCRGRPSVYIHPPAQYAGLVLLYRPLASVPHS
jgi:hypothetical protein